MVICGIFRSRNKGLRSEQWWPIEESFWLFLHSLAVIPGASILGQRFVKGTWTSSQISELLQLSDLGWYTFILCRGSNRCFEKTRFLLTSLSLSFSASLLCRPHWCWFTSCHEPLDASLARWNLWPESVLYYVCCLLLVVILIQYHLNTTLFLLL